MSAGPNLWTPAEAASEARAPSSRSLPEKGAWWALGCPPISPMSRPARRLRVRRSATLGPPHLHSATSTSSSPRATASISSEASGAHQLPTWCATNGSRVPCRRNVRQTTSSKHGSDRKTIRAVRLAKRGPPITTRRGPGDHRKSPGVVAVGFNTCRCGWRVGLGCPVDGAPPNSGGGRRARSTWSYPRAGVILCAPVGGRPRSHTWQRWLDRRDRW